MIAAWMLGATLFALLLAVAATASERALHITRGATRTPWVVALVLSIVWPASAPFVLRAWKAEAPVELAAIGATVSPASIIAEQLPLSTTWEERAAILLVSVWILASVFMLMRLAFAVRALSRITRTAQRMNLDGEPVLVTESLGPAVVGLWRPRVAVPSWFLQLDTSLRALVLRHEREHCNSRDPQLVWLASLAVALMPWNVGVWFLSRRLRLALEIDCDARTLQLEDPAKYGKLLLLIAQRQSSYPLVSMLAESTSHLSRRITAMQIRPLHRPVVRVALFTAVAAAAVVAACSPRIASDLTGPSAKPVSAVAAKLEAERVVDGQVFFESQVEVPVSLVPGSPFPTYPAELKARGISGKVHAMFVVNEQGLPDTSTLKVLMATDQQFAAAIRAALPAMRFTAATVGGRPVKQLIQQPFVFGVDAADSLPRASAGAPTQSARSRSQEVLKLAPMRVMPAATRTQSPEIPHPKYAAGSPMPRYPTSLKGTGAEGWVTIMFVMNRDGTADVGSLKVLKSDGDAFTDAVKSALPDMRFEPPMLNGQPVRQLVQMPFQFSTSR